MPAGIYHDWPTQPETQASIPGRFGKVMWFQGGGGRIPLQCFALPGGHYLKAIPCFEQILEVFVRYLEDDYGRGLKSLSVGYFVFYKIFFGMKSYMMQDQWGQIQESHSVSAGLDFPSVGPQHAHLKNSGRGTYVSVTDDQALEAFQLLACKEGIIPALESAHALAWAIEQARKHPEKQQNLLINLSGRGDKDIFTVDEILQARNAGKETSE